MKNKKLFLLLLIVIILVSFATITSQAGDWIDYDSDMFDSGGSGGWDTSWGSDSSSSWGSWGNLIFLGGGGNIVTIFIVIFIIIFIVNIFKRFAKKGYSGNFNHTTSNLSMSDSSSVDYTSLALLKSKDPNFSESAMLSKVNNLYTTLQLAWCNLDYEKVRPFLSNALYEEQAKQLADKRARDEKNISSQIAVLQSKLESYSNDGHTDYLNVWLRVKLQDYLVKISNPTQIVAGTPGKTFYLDFRWQFIRTAGGLTDAATDAVKTGECPNCGAAINMNQSGKCEYCGSVISTTEYDWVLNKIERLQQMSR